MAGHTSSALERSALDLLARELAPAVPKDADARLTKALRAAADRGDLRPLDALSERQRRDLLTLLEVRAGPTWGPEKARAAVWLTTTLAGAPQVVRGRRLGAPAR